MRGYLLHRPSRPLAGLIDYFWSLSDVPSHSMERVIPSGTVELVFNLNEGCGRSRFAVVSGAYGRPFDVETRVHAALLGVHFKPGGAGGLLGVPAGELSDTHLELAAIWGRRAVELRDRLGAAAHASQRFRILEQSLLGLLSGSVGIRDEVAAGLGRLEAIGVEVGDVARQVGLSHRRFIELFTEQVGMTPKRYARVRRLQNAIGLATGHGAPPWTQVALDCGYFDQAHLCRDWVEFTGLSPVEFLRLRAVRAKDNHVALPEPTRSNFSNTPPITTR